MAWRTMENAFDLHYDSIHLFRRKSYGSALALSVLAAEEIGKYSILEDILYNGIANRPWSAEDTEKWLRMTYDHGVKQRMFGEMAERVLSGRSMVRIDGGTLERHKQRGVYVGLPRRGRKADLSARFSAPRHLGRAATRAQITTVSDCLVTLCLGCSADYYLLESIDVQDALKPSVARTLNRRWPTMSRKAQTFARTANPKWWSRRAITHRIPGQGA